MTRAAAVLVGCILAALPYLVYGTSSHTHGPHVDHGPRHGGELFMIGDHHLEVVKEETRVEIFTSDAVRKAIRPEAGRVSLQRGSELEMRWESQRLVGVLGEADRVSGYEVTIADGLVLPLPAR